MKAFMITVPRLDLAYDRRTVELIAGENVSKVRYHKFISLSDCFSDLKIMDINVRRWPQYDDAVKDEVLYNSLGWKQTCNCCGDTETFGIFRDK